MHKHRSWRMLPYFLKVCLWLTANAGRTVNCRLFIAYGRSLYDDGSIVIREMYIISPLEAPLSFLHDSNERYSTRLKQNIWLRCNALLKFKGFLITFLLLQSSCCSIKNIGISFPSYRIQSL